MKSGTCVVAAKAARDSGVAAARGGEVDGKVGEKAIAWSTTLAVPYGA